MLPSSSHHAWRAHNLDGRRTRSWYAYLAPSPSTSVHVGPPPAAMTLQDEARALVSELIAAVDANDPLRLYSRATHVGEVLVKAAQIAAEVRGQAITDMWGDGSGATYQQIAELTGMSQQRVSQIVSATLRRQGAPKPKRGPRSAGR